MSLDKLRKRVVDIHGSQAQAWLTGLPELLHKYQKLWDITLLDTVPDLSYNLVYFATSNSDQTPVIFKAGVPHADLTNEIIALEYFAGHACVKILQHNQEDGVMLLEQAIPGNMLSTLSLQGHDAEAVTICANVIRMLHKPAVITSELRNLPRVSDRIADFATVRLEFLRSPDQYADFPMVLFEKAEDLLHELCKTTKDTVVMHGDLHHYNILSAQRLPWLAIDPKGLIGDQVFEVAAFMCNPYPHVAEDPNLPELLMQRIQMFQALLDYDAQRIRDWSAVHAILAAGQNLTSHNADWREMLHIGKILLETEI